MIYYAISMLPLILPFNFAFRFFLNENTTLLFLTNLILKFFFLKILMNRKRNLNGIEIKHRKNNQI